MGRRNYVRVDAETRKVRRRRVFMAAAVIAAGYFLAVSIFGEMGVVKYYRMKARHDALVEDIAALTQGNERLTAEAQALRSDPAYLEQLARDKLGLARPGELVYYYDEQNSKSQASNLK